MNYINTMFGHFTLCSEYSLSDPEYVISSLDILVLLI